MHPSFGIEYRCPSHEWKDLMQGPSREAVLAHTHKILHYRSLFGAGEVPREGDRDETLPAADGSRGEPARD
jgi:hypothetical protein